MNTSGLHKNEASGKKGGFTLIEIAIVVVIIGLLLGGVLKGQELIRNARAHNIASQGSAVKAAILGFMDRYRALPGDYSKAHVNIPDMICTDDGNGDSRVGGQPDANTDTDFQQCPNDSALAANIANNIGRQVEIAQVWKHLARSGFISGQYNGDNAVVDEGNWTCGGDTCLTNVYQNGLFFLYSDEQAGVTSASDSSLNNQLWTGRGIPVEMIAELDRKVDDGEPTTGSFKVGTGFTDSANAAIVDVGDDCTIGYILEVVDASGISTTSGVGGAWDVASQVTNCGGIYAF
jgi:prepilin-type N-terminal cleavage/methylation domain-containing protein